MIRLLASLALLLPIGCRDAAQRDGSIDPRNPLDRAAAEASLIVDPDTTSPIGLYERRHAVGTDAICVAGEGDSDLHFGLVMHFGATLVCEGQGVARHDGGHIMLDFEQADCAINASYDGQSIALPGIVDEGCAALCGPRASMSGGAMARVGWSVDDALRLTSRRDVVNGRRPRALCQK